MGPLVSDGDVTSDPGAMVELLQVQYERVFFSYNLTDGRGFHSEENTFFSKRHNKWLKKYKNQLSV